MKSLLRNFLLGVCCLLPVYLISGGKARADGWGCQVILCLSNPGGPTEYAECLAPIRKLWRELAKGHAFPTCSGVGFHSSRPGYEPYYCDAGYRLLGDYGPHGQEAVCLSSSLKQVSNALCSDARDEYNSNPDPLLSPRWQRADGRLQCMGYASARPNVRSQPHYLDVTIDGSGTQRVWY